MADTLNKGVGKFFLERSGKEKRVAHVRSKGKKASGKGGRGVITRLPGLSGAAPR